MIITDITVGPSDFIGPTITVTNPNTIAPEEWTAELAAWLLARGLDQEPGPRIVVRRGRFIHAVMERTGPAEALPHIAERIASTWHAVYAGIPSDVGGFVVHGVHTDRAVTG